MTTQSTQTIIWTALPNGIGKNEQGEPCLRLSVLVSPRLNTVWTPGTTPPELSLFQDFVHWPNIARHIGFKVHFDRDAPSSEGQGPAVLVTPTVRDKDVAALGAQLFNEMFHDHTFVRPYAFEDLSNRFIVSFPVGNVLAYLKRAYQTVAGKSSSNLPAVNVLGESLQEIAFFDPRDDNRVGGKDRETRMAERMNIRRQVFQNMKPPGARAFKPGSSNPAQDFQLVKWFHSPHGTPVVQSGPSNGPMFKNNAVWGSIKPAALPEPNDFAAMIDLHQIVSAVSRYPTLQRMLGWTFDLEVPLASVIGAAPPSPCVVWVEPLSDQGAPIPWSLPTSPNLPKTRYALDANHGVFLAQSSVPDVGRGMLVLTNSDYQLVQVDVDGAALKAMNTSFNMARSASGKYTSLDSPETAGLPSLRTKGISLVLSGRALRLAQALQKAHDHNTTIVNPPPPPPAPVPAKTPPAILSAEDLVRGYRVDIGIVDPATGQVTVDPATVRSKWYSLCFRDASYRFVPRDPAAPSTTVQVPSEEGFVQMALTQAADDTEDKDLYLHESIFTWSGWSLCARRIGKMLDSEDGLAEPDGELPPGFGLDTRFDMAHDSRCKLPKLRFGTTYKMRVRLVDLAGNGLDVDDPTIAAGAEASQGELYTRFEPVAPPALALVNAVPPRWGESISVCVIRSYNPGDKTDHKLDLVPTTEMVSRALVAPATSQSMVEAAGLLDEVIGEGAQSGDQAPGKTEQIYELLAKRDGRTLPAITGEGDIYGPSSPDGGTQGAPVKKTYSTWTTGSSLPYLPDPFSRGVSIRFSSYPNAIPPPGLRNTDASFFPAALNAPWHSPRPIRIEVRDIDQYPYAIGVQRVGSSFDATTGVLTVYLPKGETAFVRVSSLLGELDPGTLLPQKDGITRLNQMGMWQWIKGVTPAPDPTAAVMGQNWMITPYQDLRLVHAVQQPLTIPAMQQVVATSTVIGDTSRQVSFSTPLHKKSTSKVDVNASWADHIDDPKDSSGPQWVGHKAHVAEIPIVIERPDDVLATTVEHRFGDTKYRKVRYAAVATTRFRECFPPAYSDPDNADKPQYALTRTSDPLDPNACIDVPSTARPAAPRVRSVIPTFGWSSQGSSRHVIQSKRIGNGLRVYLERGWYSSGDGELLGVVLREGALPAAGAQDPLKSHVSDVGADPLWEKVAAPANPLTAAHFTRSEPVDPQWRVQQLPLAEVPGQHVKVVPHLPTYDPDTGLWFCDITMDLGATYFPFVRLALARYQPGSIPNVELSPVVLADIMQLAPDRTATVTFDASDHRHLTVSVAGSGPLSALPYANEEMAGDLHFEVSVEVRRAEIADKHLGWEPCPGATVNIAENAQRLAGVLFHAHVDLPSVPGPHLQARLVIKEYEIHRKDEYTTLRRLVYADTVGLYELTA